MTLSTKGKVALWIAGSMLLLSAAAVCALLFIGTTMDDIAARTRLETTVRHSLSEMEIEVNQGHTKLDDNLDQFNIDIHLSVYSDGGAGEKIYGRVPEGFDIHTPFEFGEIRETGRGRWFVYDLMFDAEGSGSMAVRGVVPADETNDTYLALMRLALFLLPLFALLAAGGGWLLTARAFAPVRRITETARGISGGGDLSARVAIPAGSDEISGLAAMLDEMFARLEKSFEQERRFSADVSHELRTPLAVVIAQCENAIENASGDEKAAFQAVLAQASRMASIIAQLLALAKSGAENTLAEKEHVDFSTLAEAVAEQYAEIAAAKNIAVSAEIEPNLSALGDETMLARLVSNLLDNAVKFGRENGFAKIRAFSAAGKIVCEISDDGQGIAPEHLGRVFDRFFQSEQSRASGNGGAGLGLTMARHIARLHGGDITVSSAPARGSVFTLTLPRQNVD